MYLAFGDQDPFSNSGSSKQFIPGLRIDDILVRIRFRTSDQRIRLLLFSSLTFKMATNKFLFLSSFAYYFLKVHLHNLSKIKSLKEVTKQ